MTFDHAIRILHAALHLGFFCLMGLGLLIASFFLWMDKLDGAEWVAVCSVLFSADRIGHALGRKE